MVGSALMQLVLKVAFRNLWLYRVKTLVIGALLGLGAFLAVVGLSLLRDVESSMRESIIGSIAGHLQIYSDKAKDELALFGGGFMGRSDIGELTDIVPYRKIVLEHPNVAALVPMGMDMAILGRGNEMDGSLDAYREALKSQDQKLIKDRIDQLRFQFDQLKKEADEQKKLSADTVKIDENLAILAKAEAPGFLESIQQKDEEKLQFLETKIAPLSGEKSPIYLGYIGTDIEQFQANFKKFRVIQGESLPQGQRGILIANKVREDFLKALVARLFDKIYKRSVRTGIKIKGDPDNERFAGDLSRQYQAIISSLNRQQAEELSVKFSALGLGSTKEELLEKLTEQLQQFLKVDDQNFQNRYRWFYDNIAPLMKLYEISPGETIMLRAYTRSGYIKSLALKVYGVYTFTGLEDSDISGQTNIIDLVSFRELYGKMTESSQAELKAMRSEIGIKDVGAQNAEEALFGEESQGELESRSLLEAAADSGARLAEKLDVKPVLSDRFDPEETTRGLALNAAIKLKDPSQLAQTQKELEAKFKEAGLQVRVIDWQKASGVIGQFVNIIQVVLVFAICIIFMVALVIINNSIIIGTLNRIREIGTMRAIGAQKSFITALFLAETAITGIIGSILGTGAAVILLLFLHLKGIPAMSDVLAFFFSGPRLYPELRPGIMIVVPVLVTLIATLTSIYAARHAAHIQPAEAMQEKE